MRTPSLQSVDSQFDVLFGAHVLPDDIARRRHVLRLDLRSCLEPSE